MVLLPGLAGASPWLETGDLGLREDAELLASAGLLRGPITSWPLPASEIMALQQRQPTLAEQPLRVRAAANRLLAALTPSPGIGGEVNLSTTSRPNPIRGFASTPRARYDLQAGLSYDDGTFSAALRPGLLTDGADDDQRATLDGSYLAAKAGNWLLYGGWVDQWYGPGEVTSLLLSNNARPLPKLGLMRRNTEAFESRWLSWLGRWQLNFALGLMDDAQRIHQNTGFGAFRFTFEPISGMEIGLTRLTQFCGSGLPCSPLKTAFDLRNDEKNVNSSNDQGGIDFRYTWRGGDIAVSPYFQLMNEDTNPFYHSYSSYLGGISSSGALGTAGAGWRLTAEYSDSRATRDLFSFGERDRVGAAYNNSENPDGMRYRNRSLGFSLDSESTLASLLASITAANGARYRLALHNAQISSAQLAAGQARGSNTRNVVTATPVALRQVEAGVSYPVLRQLWVDVAARAQNQGIAPGQGRQFDAQLSLNYVFR